jgi:hypothetical protein
MVQLLANVLELVDLNTPSFRFPRDKRLEGLIVLGEIDFGVFVTGMRMVDGMHIIDVAELRWVTWFVREADHAMRNAVGVAIFNSENEAVDDIANFYGQSEESAAMICQRLARMSLLVLFFWHFSGCPTNIPSASLLVHRLELFSDGWPRISATSV